ncbi:MAG: chemotaxis protein CheD [Anaerolineales bacterium]|nr:chemotaxis protein CheD [Anaerolineales bacterium]
MNNLIPIGLGEYKVSTCATEVLVAYGIGSCLAVGMFDPLTYIAGLLHAVLPENNGREVNNPKFVDSGIRILLTEMLQKGANRRRILIYIAGGASVLNLPGYTQIFNIGSRNIAAAIAFLSEERLSIASQEIGGQTGRTVRLYVGNGRMTVQSMGQPERLLGVKL